MAKIWLFSNKISKFELQNGQNCLFWPFWGKNVFHLIFFSVPEPNFFLFNNKK